MQSRKVITVSLMLGAALPACFAATLLKGQIVDAGSDAGAGIPGVTVQVYVANPAKVIGETITDSAGRYQLEVTTPASVPLRLSISKIGYFARPTVQEVALSAEQKTTRLVREAAADAYYMQVSGNVLKSKGAGLEPYLPAVLSLPAKQKGLVLEALKGADQSVYAEFSKADKAVFAVEDFKTMFRIGSEASIRFYPNFGKSGTVLLTGKVASPGEKVDLESLILKKPGIHNVQNDVEVVPGLALERRPIVKPAGVGG